MIIDYDYLHSLDQDTRLHIEALAAEFKEKGIVIDRKSHRGGLMSNAFDRSFMNIEQLIKEGNIVKKYVGKIASTLYELCTILARVFGVKKYYFLMRVRMTNVCFEAIHLYYSKAVAFYDLRYMSSFSTKERQRNFIRALFEKGIPNEDGLYTVLTNFRTGQPLDFPGRRKHKPKEPTFDARHKARAAHEWKQVLLNKPNGKKQQEVSQESPPISLVATIPKKKNMYEDLEMIIDNEVHETNYKEWKKRNNLA